MHEAKVPSATKKVYVVAITGDVARAKNLAERQYPESACVILEKRELREQGLYGQFKIFRKLRGDALVFFVDSLAQLQEPNLILMSSFMHDCRLTVLADSSGWIREYDRMARVALLPSLMLSAICDVLTFAWAWVALLLLRLMGDEPACPRVNNDASLDLAYLYPYPLDTAVAGGAMSHVRGFLSGAYALRKKVEVFSGRALPACDYTPRVIEKKRRRFIFRESLMLSYNVRFVTLVFRLLRGRRPLAFYQRHGRFVVAGAILARLSRSPFILEYNSSELRMADYGDPVRFRSWLRLCENISLSQANLVVVVSLALRLELLERGVPSDKILVRPNAVDADVFHPNCGGTEVRRRLGFAESDIVAGFVGTFSYWHGIKTLEAAILRMFDQDACGEASKRVRFLLVGDGPLCSEMRKSLNAVSGECVRFTGMVPHEQIPAYLDAADILLSPHVPMPDGRPFFGSPTKLFEYMAMSKAIVASRLEQLSEVLRHGESGWLVEPGNAAELTQAILFLAQEPQLRCVLGQNARAAAVAEHSWQGNVAQVMSYFSGGKNPRRGRSDRERPQ